jgi:F0F1-type ATP synthase membrane subunit c/vacuolar-type H+-ATPase subunit K
MRDMSFDLTIAALIVGGVLIVAAKYHRFTYRPLTKGDRRKERRLYWWSWAIGGPLTAAAMIPTGWKAVLAVGFAALFAAVAYGPLPWNRRKWESSS